MSRYTSFGPSGASQNVGNSINPNHPSVKVAAPPGGASSFSLGWGSEPAPAYERRGGRRAVGPGGAAPEPAPPAAPPAPAVMENAYAYPAAAPAPAAAAPAPAAYDAPPYGARSGLSSNSYAQGSNQNAGNVLTDRRITKVLAPPGGRSQITFG